MYGIWSMDRISPNHDQQFLFSEPTSSVCHSLNTDGARQSHSLLTKLAYSASASWLSNGRQYYGV